MADLKIIGSVVDGVYSKTKASEELTKTATVSTSKTEEKGSVGYDKDMFLKLLVAEMQYQDPMEPTNNSEYVAQFASFTQIEAIQSVQNDMADMQANSLVGKFVALIDDNNEEQHGTVDYVRTDDDGQKWVSVNGKEYEIEKITSIVDEKYYTALTLADTLLTAIEKIPNLEQLTLGNAEQVQNAVTMYNSMDSYTQGYIANEYVKFLENAIAKIAELQAEKDKADAEEAARNKKVEETTNETQEETTPDTQSEETAASAEVAEEVVPEGE